MKHSWWNILIKNILIKKCRTYSVYNIPKIRKFKYLLLINNDPFENSSLSTTCTSDTDNVNPKLSQREKCPCSEFFWSVFSCSQTGYGREKLRMWENADQKKSEYGHFLCSVFHFFKKCTPAEIPFKTEHFDIKDWQVFRKTKDLKTIYLFFNLFFHSLDTKKMVWDNF